MTTIPSTKNKSFCVLPKSAYAYIWAVHVNSFGENPEDFKLYWRLDQDDRGLILVFLNGVTGYESYYVDGDFLTHSYHEKVFITSPTPRAWDGIYVYRTIWNDFIQYLKEQINGRNTHC